jgi:DNA-binding response OmpR family regulator
MTKRRILIVEDEPLIAMMLEDFLEAGGMAVAGVSDTVQSALAVAGEGGVDGAILDVNLSGGEKSWPVAQALADQGIPFLFATGGGDGSIHEDFRGRPTINKPYTLDGVTAAIGDLFA